MVTRHTGSTNQEHHGLDKVMKPSDPEGPTQVDSTSHGHGLSEEEGDKAPGDSVQHTVSLSGGQPPRWPWSTSVAHGCVHITTKPGSLYKLMFQMLY